MNFYEFAGQHPIVTVLLFMIVAHMPVAIIQALKTKRNSDD